MSLQRWCDVCGAEVAIFQLSLLSDDGVGREDTWDVCGLEDLSKLAKRWLAQLDGEDA